MKKIEKQLKNKQEKIGNKRNYINCFSDNNNSPSNPCRSNNCHVNRREWNTKSSNKSKE